MSETPTAKKLIAPGCGEANKNDDGKAPWRLLPTDAIGCVLEVLRKGAEKYGERNWEKGMAWCRCYDAAMRHVDEWFRGVDRDKETGISHLAHAATNILFLLAYEMRGVGTDDRMKDGIVQELRE